MPTSATATMRPRRSSSPRRSRASASVWCSLANTRAGSGVSEKASAGSSGAAEPGTVMAPESMTHPSARERALALDDPCQLAAELPGSAEEPDRVRPPGPGDRRGDGALRACLAERRDERPELSRGVLEEAERQLRADGRIEGAALRKPSRDRQARRLEVRRGHLEQTGESRRLELRRDLARREPARAPDRRLEPVRVLQEVQHRLERHAEHRAPRTAVVGLVGTGACLAGVDRAWIAVLGAVAAVTRRPGNAPERIVARLVGRTHRACTLRGRAAPVVERRGEARVLDAAVGRARKAVVAVGVDVAASRGTQAGTRAALAEGLLRADVAVVAQRAVGPERRRARSGRPITRALSRA